MSAQAQSALGDRRLPVYLSIVVVALVSWAFAFLTPESKFWDDWVTANTDTVRMTSELGLPWVGYLDNGIMVLGPWAFKCLVIIATIVVAVALYEISGKRLGLASAERWFLAVLVVALPLFTMRVMISVATYSWSFALFMVAWYLLVRKVPAKQNFVLAIVVAVLLFVSYTTASLLLFTALPLLHLLYLSIDRNRGFWKSVPLFVARYWYVIAAPVVFWVLRAFFFRPYGLYVGYNGLFPSDPAARNVVLVGIALALSFIVACVVFLYWLLSTARNRPWLREFVALAVLTVITAVFAVFLYKSRISLTVVARVVPLALLAAAIVLAVAAVRILVRRKLDAPSIQRDQSVVPLLAAGLGAVILAMLPYMLVGKLPNFGGWETRHQVLMPIGVATIIVAAFRAVRPIVPTLGLRVVSIALVAIFAASSLSVTLALVADSRKQSQVIAQLAASGVVRNSRTIVFEDQSQQLNYDDVDYSFYEYTGWLLTAFGNEKRLGLDKTGVASYLAGGLDGLQYAAARYGYGQYVPTNRGVLVEIQPLAGASEWSLLLNETSVKITVTPVTNIASLK